MSDQQRQVPGESPARAEDADRRMPEIVGDRPCATCGFNLHGQIITREPHYGLLIVRCPECSAVAPLQEYPSLGRWSVRLSRLAAAVFVLAVIGAFAGTSIMMAGIATIYRESAVREVARRIATEHRDYQNAQTAAGTTGATRGVFAQLNGWEYDLIDMNWWATVNPATFTGDIPAFWSRLTREEWTGVGGLILLFGVVGSVWSVMLCAVPRRKILLFALFVMMAALTVHAVMTVSDSQRSTPLTMAIVLARQLVKDDSGWWVIGLETAAISIGLILGRPLCRLLLRALLVPRHLYVFGWLWMCDGAALPRPARRS
ncbi:MAG: hypothetical protein AMXMBFR58_27060 [Phycisphaerae bacterium]